MPNRRWLVPVVDPEPLYSVAPERSGSGSLPDATVDVQAGESLLVLVTDGDGTLERGERSAHLRAGDLLLVSETGRFALRGSAAGFSVVRLSLTGMASLRYASSLMTNFGDAHRVPRRSVAFRQLVALADFCLSEAARDPIEMSLRVHHALSHLHERLQRVRPAVHSILTCQVSEISLLPLPLLRFSVAEWASRMGTSRSALTRSLRARWGRAPGGVLKEARIQASERLLQDARYSVADVAAALGFSCSRAFIFAFRRSRGTTPAVWRKGRPPARFAGSCLRPAWPPPVPAGDPRPGAEVAREPRVANWDGHFYRLLKAGLFHRPERGPHDNALNTMEYTGVWMLTLGGEARFELGRQAVSLTRGTIVCFNQPSFTRWRTVRETGRWDRLVLYFTWEIAMGYFNYLQKNYGGMVDLPSRDCPPVRTALRLVAMSRSRRRWSAHAWSRTTFRFLTEWHRLLEGRRRRGGRPHLMPIREASLVSYTPRTIRRFAERLGYSRPYLSARLRRQWDAPPGRVMRRLRLDEAAMILRGTNRDVATIARRVGFHSVSSFCRAFRRRFGDSPLRYRRSVR